LAVDDHLHKTFYTLERSASGDIGFTACCRLLDVNSIRSYRHYKLQKPSQFQSFLRTILRLLLVKLPGLFGEQLISGNEDAVRLTVLLSRNVFGLYDCSVSCVNWPSVKSGNNAIDAVSKVPVKALKPAFPSA